MSKSRTGRKGRVRAALAAALGEIDSAVGDATIVDTKGRLGASSGFRAADDDKSNAVILDYIQKQLNKPGTENALFQQGELRGALSNAVDTQNGANGAITAADTGAYASATGEKDIAAIAPLSTGGGTFAHYVFPTSVEAGTQSAAITLAAGGAATGQAAQDSQLLTTDLRGIVYHPGGPGSNFVPLRDLGCGITSPVSSTQIVINPSVDTIWSDTGVTNPTSLRLEVAGQLLHTTGGDNTEGGDEILIQSTNNTAAVAKIRWKTEKSGHATTTEGFGVGHELVIRDTNNEVVMTVVGANTGNSAGVYSLTATAPDGGADSAAKITAGLNFDATTSAASKKVYVVAHASAGGATAYPGGTGTTANDGAGQFNAVLIAAINALSDSIGAGISAGTGTGATFLNLNYDRYRGTTGRNANAATNDVSQSTPSALSVAAYSAEGQLLVPAAAKHAYFGDETNTSGLGANAASSIIGFAGGTDGTVFGTVKSTLQGDDGDGGIEVGVQVNCELQDFPIRVVYNTDDARRTGSTGGIPTHSSAGFVVVWGPV